MDIVEEWHAAQAEVEEFSRQFEGTITIDQIQTPSDVVRHLFEQMKTVAALEDAMKDDVAGLLVRLRNSEARVEQVQEALNLLQRMREVKEKLRAQVENVRNIMAEHTLLI